VRYRTALNIDLNIFADNVQKLRQLCPHKEILFMAKADAYGHGMIPLVRFAAVELGIKEFGLATLGEARRLRDELSDLEFETYVFSDTQYDLHSSADLYLQKRIIPVIANQEALQFILTNPRFRHFPLCLKFNTGMNRLGFTHQEWPTVIAAIKGSGRGSIYHLISHFSSASSPRRLKDVNQAQLREFHDLKSFIRAEGLSIERSSMANSGAIEQGLALEETHIRPGLMLYGPTSYNQDERHLSTWTGKTISRLETNIINVFPAAKGIPVGYGATRVPQEGVMALIALGYGDGFSTRFQGAKINFHGVPGEIFGRVNMDMSQIYFPGRAPEGVKAGESFVIWGHDPQEILNFAEQTKTIPYELTCQLTDRVPRIYGLQ
jgi:alanine racemase